MERKRTFFTVEMEEKEFENMLEKANLTKQEFLNLIDCKIGVLYRWAKEKKYPLYVKTILNWIINARKIDEPENINKFADFVFDEKIEKYNNLKTENTSLKDKIKKYEELEKLYTELFL